MNPRMIIGWLLCLTVASSATAQDEATRQYDALTKAHDAAIQGYRDALTALMRTPEYLEARKNRDGAKITELRQRLTDPTASFVPKFQAAAGRFEGQDGAVPFLLWIVTKGSQPDAARAALGTLIETHGTSTAIAPLVVNSPYSIGRAGLPREEALEVLATLIENAATEEIRAHALYARAMTLQRGSDEDEQAAQVDLKRARELADGTLLADRIDAPEFEKKNLQIGMVAPDVVGKDVDGVEFKLSDYRGKVVVLDFWGDW